jgi:hypothetical protein
MSGDFDRDAIPLAQISSMAAKMLCPELQMKVPCVVHGGATRKTGFTALWRVTRSFVSHATRVVGRSAKGWNFVR